MIYVIGAGGVGSLLTPVLCMLKGKENVTLIDGDRLEEKNLNRQLFDSESIGEFKAEALAKKYGCSHLNQYYSFGSIEHERNDWLMVCVDNNSARRSCLEAVDRFKCSAIFAANEQFSSEAYLFIQRWKDTRLDPRVYFPEILRDDGNDPMAAAIGCTGLAQVQSPQLVTSNMSAAALAGGLFTLWNIAIKKLDREVIPKLPYRRVVNLTGVEEFKVGLL